MSKRVFRLVHAQARAGAVNAIRGAEDGSVVTVADPTRNLDQNALWWALLGEIAVQAVHPVSGARLPAEWWRMVVLDALGAEQVQARVPSLDGSHDVPVGLSSSKLDKKTFGELIELTYATGAELGVNFPDGSSETGGAKNPARAAA